MHNILQGVAKPEQRLSQKEKDSIRGWITNNAERYWFSEDGPLQPPEKGGADIIVVSTTKLPRNTFRCLIPVAFYCQEERRAALVGISRTS
jgi:hypothetical protein